MIAFYLLLTAAFCADSSTVTFEIDGLRDNDGVVQVLLFTADSGYPTKFDRAAHRATAKIEHGHATVALIGVPKGTYAANIWHDADGDGKLGTNIIGMPKEGVGASNNAKGFMGPPSFEKASFTVEADVKQTIEMVYLF